jgi:hypothetical protein
VSDVERIETTNIDIVCGRFRAYRHAGEVSITCSSGYIRSSFHLKGAEDVADLRALLDAVDAGERVSVPAGALANVVRWAHPLRLLTEKQASEYRASVSILRDELALVRADEFLGGE